MRPYWVLLLLVPLAGCVQPPAASVLAGWALPSGSPDPIAVAGCDDLLDELDQRALAEADAALDMAVQGHGGRWYGRGMMPPVALTASEMADADGSAYDAAGAQVTGTNNQETDVDEADVLKTDGQWTYVLQGGSLFILYSENVGDVREHARVPVEGHGGTLLLVDREDAPDRLVLVLPTWHMEASRTSMLQDSWMPQGATTVVQVLDLEDRARPRIVEEFALPGHDVGARLVGDVAYIVAHEGQEDLGLRTWVRPDQEDLDRWGITRDVYHRMGEGPRTALHEEVAAQARAQNRQTVEELTLEDHLPPVLQRDGDGELAPRGMDDDACRRFLAVEGQTGRGTNTILALDAGRTTVASQLTQVLGGRPILYGAEDALVFASASRDAWWFWDHADVDEATDLQWFDLAGLDVRHRASGRIPGIVQDSFGIDVHDDQLRVTTTTGQWSRWWVEDAAPMVNHLVVLEEKAGLLAPTGIVGPLAPGERIWSTRFTDDRAYMVTFEEVDPLYVIDLADPRAPRVLGELKIPGVSTYIHPLSDEALLTIGYGPGPGGRGLDRGSLQVSLFDITDPTDPRRADLLDVSPDGGWSWSQAAQEHKAFTYWDAVGVLALPLTTQQQRNTVSSHGLESTTTMHVALRLIDVDPEAMTLRLRGEVDQDRLLSEDGSYWNVEIQRSHFLGYPETGLVSVYAMSPLGVTAHDLETLEAQGSTAFL